MPWARRLSSRLLLWKFEFVCCHQVVLWNWFAPDLMMTSIITPRSGIEASAPTVCTRASSTDA